MKNFWKEFVSAETNGLKEISVLWRDWDFAYSEANYFISGWFWPSGLAIPSPNSVSELTSHDNK